MSSPLVIATGTVTGQVVNASGVAVSGAQVLAKLNAGQFTPQSIAPAGQVVPVEIVAYTDSNGFWSMPLVPNNNISPANTTYTIQVQGMPDVPIQLNDTASHAYLSLAVGPVGATLAPVAQTIPGALTVTGTLTATGELDVTGPAAFHGPDPWYDVKHPAFGAKGDGVTDDTAAFQAALNAASAQGGTVYVPPSATPYVLASALTLKSMVRLQGGGPGTGTGASQIKFTGTSGPLLAGNGVTGAELCDLAISWPSAFAGTVADLSSSGLSRVFNCDFFANGGGSAAALIVGFDNSSGALVDHCLFHNAQVGVQGVGASGHFSIGCTVRNCQFSSSTGDISTAHLNNPGSGWVIENNIFQMGTGAGTPQAIAQSITGSTAGVHVAGNWFGNAGPGALTYVSATGSGWVISGGVMIGNSNAGTTLISCGSNTFGVLIAGVEFLNAGTGVAFVGGNVQQVCVLGCIIGSSITNPYSTQLPGSGLLFSPSATNFGAVRLFSSLQRSAQAPAFAASYTPDPTLGESVEMTLTANITVNAPANGLAGQRLVFKWLQDGTGTRTITYNAAYHTGGATAITTGANTMTIDMFECSRDGTTWRLISRITGQA